MRYGVGGVGAAGAFFCGDANSDFFVKPAACSSLERALLRLHLILRAEKRVGRLVDTCDVV